MSWAPAKRKRAQPRLFARLADARFLSQAWRHVLAHYRKDNVPTPLTAFDQRRESRLDDLAKRIREQTFLPQTASLIYIPKPDHPGEERSISLLVPEDRIILTALNLLLSPILDRQFLPSCYAYRPGRGANSASEAVARHIADGFTHVAGGDIDDFFPSIDRDLLLKAFRRKIWETPIVNLLEAFLYIGSSRNLEWQDSGRGLAQGSALSPLLSNLYLGDFDQWLQAARLPWARYADNILILAKDAASLQTVWDAAQNFLSEKCLLRFNHHSQFLTVASYGFEFLGFHFQNATRTMSPAKLDNKRTELSSVFRRNTDDIKALTEHISEMALGWRHYYGAVETTRPQLELLERHLEDLLVRWLQAFRAGKGRPSAAQLKAILAGMELPVINDERQKIKWIELQLSRSKPVKPLLGEQRMSPQAVKAIRERKKELAERRQSLEEIVVTKPGTYLGRTGERLLIRREGRREAEIPFSFVRNITFLTTAISLSGEFIVETAARGIPILIAGPDGRPAVRIGAPDLPAHQLSLAQSVLASSPASLELARVIVAGKIRNQINLLQYFLKYPERRSGGDFLGVTTHSIGEMEHTAQTVLTREFSTDHELERNRLFAAEGQAAQSYWTAVKTLLWWKPGFDRRVHRGASDLLNCLLNYGYGILYSRLWIVLIKTGLNVNVGFLHKPQPGKAGLLYDFIEEFRAAAVDRVVFSLLNLAADLKLGEHGLEHETRHVLARKILERLQAKTRYHGESLPLQKVMELQAQLMVQHIEGKGRYRPFVLPW